MMTLRWSATKDMAKLWEEAVDYIWMQANNFGGVGENDRKEEAAEDFTKTFGFTPAEVFGQCKGGMALSFIEMEMQAGGVSGCFVLPVKDEVKAREIARKMQESNTLSRGHELKEKDYKGVKITYSQEEGNDDFVGGYAFIDGNCVMGSDSKTLEKIIDANKEGKTISAQLTALQKQGLDPKAGQASLLYVVNLSRMMTLVTDMFGMIGGMGMGGPELEIIKELGFNNDTMIISATTLDNPQEITNYTWYNIPLSRTISRGLKLAQKMAGGGEGLEKDGEEDE